MAAFDEAKLTIGKTATVTTTVSTQNTASAVCSGTLDVFSTPMMIALMESAACEALRDALDETQTSVGTRIAVDHMAASPLGAAIAATAAITAVDGRMISFDVTAFDGETQIGRGTHTRAIIDPVRFMAKLAARV